MPRVSLNRGDAYKIALQRERRVNWRELREICDEFTGYRLDPWELDKLTQWTEEHPAYRALPEIDDDQPQLPETSLES